jgi:epoxyqueuosine reductase
MRPDDLAVRLKTEARRLGFDSVGIAPAVAAPGYPDFLRWLQAERAASMEYMKRHVENRAHPESILEGVRSVIMVMVVYGRNDPGCSTMQPTEGKVARYARGTDYHDVLREKLGTLLAWLACECPGIRGRPVVDTAPLMERDYARLAGLGWIGKNTMLISRRLGSFTFLGALLVDAELPYDAPHEADHCGRCTRCLEACPTGAFDGPYQLDARRCISFWTIEHRGTIPDESAGALHDWVFGCDACQDVCPWNRKAPSGRLNEFGARAEWTNPDLLAWLARDAAEFKQSLKGTALARSRRTGLLRNAALILGTRKLPAAVGPLADRLDDPQEDPIIRGSAAWALGRIGSTVARAALVRHQHDPVPEVRAAVRRALEIDTQPPSKWEGPAGE